MRIAFSRLCWRRAKTVYLSAGFARSIAGSKNKEICMTTKLNSPRPRFGPIVLALLFLATSALAGAQTERAIHTFAGEPDGQEPYATLVFDKAGNLYGTTIYGGTFNQGSIFKLTPSGFS